MIKGTLCVCSGILGSVMFLEVGGRWAHPKFYQEESKRFLKDTSNSNNDMISKYGDLAAETTFGFAAGYSIMYGITEGMVKLWKWLFEESAKETKIKFLADITKLYDILDDNENLL